MTQDISIFLFSSYCTLVRCCLCLNALVYIEHMLRAVGSIRPLPHLIVDTFEYLPVAFWSCALSDNGYILLPMICCHWILVRWSLVALFECWAFFFPLSFSVQLFFWKYNHVEDRRCRLSAVERDVWIFRQVVMGVSVSLSGCWMHMCWQLGNIITSAIFDFFVRFVFPNGVCLIHTWNIC